MRKKTKSTPKKSDQKGLAINDVFEAPPMNMPEEENEPSNGKDEVKKKNWFVKWFHRVFMLRWKKGHNAFQNLFANLYLPDSKGDLSMHTTILVFVMALTGVTLIAELAKY